MIHRRDVLKWAALEIGASATPALADTTAPAKDATGAPVEFGVALVLDRARALAKKPFAAPPTDLPAPFGKLDYDRYVAIRQKPGSAIWAGDNVGFALEPLHRGFIFSAPMVINLVENGQAKTA